MTVMSYIVLSVVVAGFVVLGVVAVRAFREQTKLTVKRRAEMLESLKLSRDKTLEHAQVKKTAEEYKKRLKRIAEKHRDSDDVPGYCTSDDMPWPCPTANLANLRKNPDLID